MKNKHKAPGREVCTILAFCPLIGQAGRILRNAERVSMTLQQRISA